MQLLSYINNNNFVKSFISQLSYNQVSQILELKQNIDLITKQLVIKPLICLIEIRNKNICKQKL